MAKYLFSLIICVIYTTTVKAQSNDTIMKRSIIQIGYVTEYIDGDAARLTGFEAQLKILFGKQKLARGEQSDVVTYFNLGYNYFPSTDYTLGQGNVGLGLNSPFPFLGKYLRMDIGIGASFYHGAINEKAWMGTKPDFGGHVQMSIPFGRRGGVYGKLSIPGGFALLSDNSYLPPVFITTGLEF